jgi:TldD protein
MYIDRYSVYEFYSSKGADITYDFQLSGLVLSIALANGNDTFSNQIMKSGYKFDDLFVSDEEVVDFVKENENYIINAKPVEAGEYPVILAPVVAGVFAHESFGHKSEADFMLGDETMRKEWELGKQVGSSILSIYDSGIDFGSGYVPYDDEGNKATKTYLIKNGVLAGRLHSATTAADLGEEVTGNARAMNTDYEPIVRMTNTVIDAGDKTVEELFAGVKHGYYIKNLKHGSGMSSFTIAPSLCYEIVDGKIGQPVKIAVITGNVFETLNLIDGLSNKTELLSFVTGGCGKMEQYPLNVGFGGPYVSISKMNVQ